MSQGYQILVCGFDIYISLFVFLSDFTDFGLRLNGNEVVFFVAFVACLATCGA